MSKKLVRVTRTLPEDLLGQIDAANPNRSEEVRKALRAWFNREPTPEELYAADDVVERADRARKEWRGE